MQMPPPDSHDLNERIQQLYDRLSGAFLECAGDTFQAGLAITEEAGGKEDPVESNLHLARRAGVKDGWHLLDAGCGIGGPSIHIASHYNNVRVDGVTLSSVQAELARARVREFGLDDRVHIQQGDYHHLPHADETFDLVYFFECTGYSPSPLQLYREVFRVLKPGGRVYVKDVFQEHRRQTEAEKREQREFDDMWALAASPTMPGTVLAMEYAGFQAMRCTRFSDEKMGGRYFIASMFQNSDPRSMELNAFGQHFFRMMPNLPSYFGEIVADKPAAR